MATISFARGIPAPECLPVGELADCARSVLERDGARLVQPAEVGGQIGECGFHEHPTAGFIDLPQPLERFGVAGRFGLE